MAFYKAIPTLEVVYHQNNYGPPLTEQSLKHFPSAFFTSARTRWGHRPMICWNSLSRETLNSAYFGRCCRIRTDCLPTYVGCVTTGKEESAASQNVLTLAPSIVTLVGLWGSNPTLPASCQDARLHHSFGRLLALPAGLEPATDSVS